MRKFDQYVARSFLGPFFLSLAFIVGLYIVGDAFSNLEEYKEAANGFWPALARMGRMYSLRVPTFIAPVLPICMLLGAAYGVAQLSKRNELVAMQSCGVSLWRVLAPVYALTVVVSLLGLANREYVVPRVEHGVADTLATWTDPESKPEPVTLFLEREQTLFNMSYSPTLRRATGFSMTRKTGEFIIAPEAEPVPGGWLLHDADVGKETVPEYLLETSLTPREVEMAQLDPSTCDLKTLRRLIRGKPDNLTFRIFYHSRLAYPFVGIVLVGLGLPFVIRNEAIQHSRMLGVGLCLVICMVFYTVQFVADDLGRSGYLLPALAAWLPTVTFGALGFYLLETLHN